MTVSVKLIRGQLATERTAHATTSGKLDRCLEQLGALVKDVAQYREDVVNRYCGLAWFSASALKRIATDWPVGLDERELIREMADLALARIPPALAIKYSKQLSKEGAGRFLPPDPFDVG